MLGQSLSNASVLFDSIQLYLAHVVQFFLSLSFGESRCEQCMIVDESSFFSGRRIFVAIVVAGIFLCVCGSSSQVNLDSFQNQTTYYISLTLCIRMFVHALYM